MTTDDWRFIAWLLALLLLISISANLGFYIALIHA